MYKKSLHDNFLCTAFLFAVSDVDFNSEPIMLTIPVGETEVCFDAQSIIIDDYVVEGTERFYVNILAVDPPEVTILPPQTEVLIEDKDSKHTCTIHPPHSL